MWTDKTVAATPVSRIVRETEKAWLISFGTVSVNSDAEHTYWFPKSQTEVYETSTYLFLVCPVWLAKKTFCHIAPYGMVGYYNNLQDFEASI
jgi:hypothetical protein